MTEETNKVITINDIEYSVNDLTDQQKALINHINDLDRKIRNTQFSLDQLNVGRQAFADMLNKTLTEESE